jgi:hypothetical protein
MRHNAYLEALRKVPAFRTLADRDLIAIGRLVDTVDVPAGTVLVADRGELVATLAPTRLLVIGRREAEAVFELSPALRTSASDVGHRAEAPATRTANGNCT